jgi:N6-adenosine-specific RNA methylase IME4
MSNTIRTPSPPVDVSLQSVQSTEAHVCAPSANVSKDGVKSVVQDIAIVDITIGDRHRKDHGDVSGLAQSIQEIGLLHPIVATPDNVLICGARRIAAVRSLGHDRIPARIVSLEKIKLGEYAENAFRKDLTLSEAVDIADAIEGPERAAAKARAQRGVGTDGSGGRGKKRNPGGNSPPVSGRASDRVGKVVGMDRKTLKKARVVRDTANADPKRFGIFKDEMDRTGRVNGPYKRLMSLKGENLRAQRATSTRSSRGSRTVGAAAPVLVQEHVQQQPHLRHDNLESAKNTIAVPEKRYGVIVVDPDYVFQLWSRDAGIGTPLPRDLSAAQDVPAIAAANCVLFLWSTIQMLSAALSALEAWGFEYKSHLVCVKECALFGKETAHSDGWVLEHHELLLIGTRGDGPRPEADLVVQSLTTAPPGKDGGKPDVFLCTIDEWFPTEAKIVLQPGTASHPAFDTWEEHGPVVGAHEQRETDVFATVPTQTKAMKSEPQITLPAVTNSVASKPSPQNLPEGDAAEVSKTPLKIGPGDGVTANSTEERQQQGDGLELPKFLRRPAGRDGATNP